MGNPLSPVLANIFMSKLEDDIVTPNAPALYHRYIDDCIAKRKKGQPDELLEELNSYHPNIKFTVEDNPSHFLDTQFQYKDGKFERSVYKKPGKIPTHWSSKIPTKWKRNSITGALHRAKRISSNLAQDIKEIRTNFIKSGYPRNFVDKTIKSFQYRLHEEEPIIPTNLFEERRRITIRIPFCERNEKASSKFVNKLNGFTQNSYIFEVIWLTRKIKSLFNLKDKNVHKSHVVYEGNCDCGVNYVGETQRNFSGRINEHSNTTKVSEPARHLLEFPRHSFTWNVITGQHNWRKRKILEAWFIALRKPELNKKLLAHPIHLFPMGVT